MKIRDLLFRNLPAKIFSLFFAIVLWGVVIGERQAHIQLDMPLELVKVPEGAVVVSDIPSSLSLQVRGPRTLLRTLPARGVRKSIDLEGMGFGWTTIRILPDSISLPRGIEVVRVTPSTLDIKLEPVVTFQLPVTPQVVGDPPKGSEVKEVTVEPPTVLLKGGKSELATLRFVKTLPVDLSQAKGDLEARVGLEVDGLHLRQASPSKVLVRVKFSPIIDRREFAGIAVRLPSSNAKASIKPDRVRVLLEGPADILDRIKKKEIRVSIGPRELDPGTHRISPAVTVPEGLRVIELEPSTVEVTVEGPSREENRR